MDLDFLKDWNSSTMSTFIPEISASKVAALIGLNKYQSPHEVMYDLLSKYEPIKAKITSIQTSEHRIPTTKLKYAVLATPAIKNIVNIGIKVCAGLTDITEALKDIERQARVVVNLRHSELPAEFREVLVTEVCGEVRKKRGLNTENAILNTYETDNNVKVEERNTKTFRKDYTDYKLIGRTDGYVVEHKRIVDSKARTRWWPEVPMYDEIQLRVYMELSGCEETELIESFPDGRVRTTKYLNSPEKWEAIETEIKDAVKKMNTMIENEEALRKLVYANTIVV
jgi:predicted transcriptional regulator